MLQQLIFTQSPLNKYKIVYGSSSGLITKGSLKNYYISSSTILIKGNKNVHSN